MIERTLVLVKPDGVARGLTGEVIKRFEMAGLKIIGLKLTSVSSDFASKHYTEAISEAHGPEVRQMLLDFVTEGPVVAMVIEGVDAIANVRKMVGSTESKSAAPGTIRGDFSHVSYAHTKENNVVVRNVIHASGNSEDAGYEVGLWFGIDELHSYRRAGEEHFY
ncbi:MAG: nucleoside-diphosphate kinase [Patescibacteria group bacterium]|jgi:nucleoside-diphosphate kinase